MKKAVIFLCLFVSILIAADAKDNAAVADLNETQQRENAIRLEKINGLKANIRELNNRINDENIWVKKYSNYSTYRNIATEVAKIDKELEKLRRYKKTKKRLKEIEELEKRRLPLAEQMELLSEYSESPYKEIIQPDDISEIPEISNPIAIISAFSFIKQIDQRKEHFDNNFRALSELLDTLRDKRALQENLLELENTDAIKESIAETAQMIEELESQLNIFSTTLSVHSKKIDEVKINLTDQITNQGKKAISIGTIIVILFVFAFFLKFVTKRYISDNERLYTANKIVNFINYTIIVIIILFAYLENVSYLVTVLGFASAGLAIAMRDWFMSILGWVVIVLGGSIHVGDRIKVMKDGAEYVGDVLDISLLRITIHEDITLTSYMHNRRTGRIIFIPNNYIFTTLISNYSHASMKTVWDGIDITITFDSNYKKAVYIAREIAKKYSKGYTDITRKQLNKLRDRYNLRNTAVEPRVFHFIEPNGMCVSTWYLTNAFATLTLRSTISGEIVEAFSKEDDITIAYPTTTVKDGGPQGLPRTDGAIPEGSFQKPVKLG